MFDIAWSEMALIAAVALIVIGPKDLPRVLRTVGVWTRKLRLLAGDFQKNLDEMVREAELDEVRRDIERVGRMDLKREAEKAIDPTGEVERALRIEDEPPRLATVPMPGEPPPPAAPEPPPPAPSEPPPASKPDAKP